jgi:hypothetical protein
MVIPMKRTVFLMVTMAMVIGVLAFNLPAAGRAYPTVEPNSEVTIPPGYREWRLISVAHEAGNPNDIRAILGNDSAIKAYRDGKNKFPDGAIISRLAWAYVPSDENNRAFGREQSFIAGSPTNIQFMIKDSKKYAATGGWGFAQFKDGKSTNEAIAQACFSCHQPVKVRDYVFTRYAP